MSQGLLLPEVDPATIDAPSAGTISIFADLNGRINVKKPDGSISVINPVNQLTPPANVTSAAAGDHSVGPGNGILPVIVTVSGGATVRTISLSKVGLTSANAGDIAMVLFNFPNTVAGITLQVFDANTSGALLFDFVTDGVQSSAIAWLYYDGAQFQILESKVPAVV